MYPTYKTKIPACLDFALKLFAEKFPVKKNPGGVKEKEAVPDKKGSAR